MPIVLVASAGEGKYKVLVNFISEGPVYSSETIAKAEAAKIRGRYRESLHKRIKELRGSPHHAGTPHRLPHHSQHGNLWGVVEKVFDILKTP